MMDKLKEKIFEFLLKRQVLRQVSAPTWDKTRRIAILHSYANIPHIIKDLEKQGKEVILFTLPDKNDVCWLSDRPKKKIREQLQSQHYDILIDLTQEESLTLQYMAMYIQAGFKTGRHIKDGIHDLTIDTPAQETPDYLYKQILRYIQMFTSKK